MTRRGRRIGGTLAPLLAVLTLASCSGDSDDGTAAAEPTASVATASPSRAATPDDATSPTEAPKPGSMDTPATTSGPLSSRSFPTPGRLGPGWSYAVDPGDAEEGYSGNGTPTLARNPREVALAAVPMGCPRPADLPVPRNALEVDYDVDGTRVIAIRAAFASARQSADFFHRRTAAIEQCVGTDGGTGLGVLVDQTRVGTDYFGSDRTPDSDPWVELSFLDGRQVLLVAAPTRFGEAPMTDRQIQRLSATFGGAAR